MVIMKKKETATKSPTKLFSREDTETSLNEVRWLINKLREIHYYQIFEPPIRIGILSGYILTRKEKPCSYYPHSQYRKAVQWMLDLNNIKYVNESNLLDGGILINSGGQPFVYSWNINTGSRQLLVNFIPTLSNIESDYVGGMPVLSINESLRISHEALLLKRYFNVETEWDYPNKGIVGPKEIDIEFDKLLGNDRPKTRATVYRPVKELSPNIIPLVHSSSHNTIWNKLYPIVAIKFGRGFLIHTGMILDGEREYKILLDIIRRLSLVGYETLAKTL